MTIRIGLLGAGRIGHVHARAISSDRRATLAAVADAAPDAAEVISARYQCPVRSIGEIAEDGDIDAVAICTPTDTHADLIEMFAHAGKPIFCEKPVDLDLTRVRACLATVDRTGARLMIGFNRRFDPHFAALRAAIDAGKVGEVEMVHIISRDPGLPHLDFLPASGGLFRDMTIHDFDMARLLLGEEIIRVYASASVLVDPIVGELGDHDSASIVLTTRGGRQCMISNSRRATYGYDQRIEVHGSLGLVSAENPRPACIEIANSDGYTRAPIYRSFMTRYEQAYAAEIGAFIDMITEGTAPSPSGHDGLMALMLAEAAVISVAEHRAVEVSELAPA